MVGGRYSREFPGSGIPAHGCEMDIGQLKTAILEDQLKVRAEAQNGAKSIFKEEITDPRQHCP